MPSARMWSILFYVGVVAGVILLIWLPRTIASILLFGFFVAALVYFSITYFDKSLIFTSSESRPRTMPGWVSRIYPFIVVAELILITWMAVTTTDAFWKNDPDQTLPGREVEWQVNTAYTAAQSWRDYGYIPLWNPWLEYGHPLFDNAQSFLLNPFATLPSLLWGGVRGIKLGVGIHALLATWGGWFLGRVLNLGTVGRVLLALLMLGKGNMLAMFGAGYYQLALAQAYFPWIVAGTLAMLRGEGRRWPVGLVAVALTLQFWGGTIWYSLPMALTVGLMAAFYGVGWLRQRINGAGLRNLMLTGIFTLGLSAMTLIPLWLQREYMGAHPDDTSGGTKADLGEVIEQYYTTDVWLYVTGDAPGEAHFYYSFITPLWYAAILFLFLPPIPRVLHRESQSQTWRLWAVAGIMIVVCTLWGAGGNPVIVWLYQHVPLLPQWRFVGRALAVASFWIAVLIAMRVDGLWRVIWYSDWYRSSVRPSLIHAAQVFLSGLLVVASWAAASEVNDSWENFAGTVGRDFWKDDRTCIAWLRENNPDAYLSAYQYGYEPVVAYIENRVVMWDIEADFEPLPLEFTLSHRNVTQTRPEYAVAWSKDIRRAVADWGYKPVPGSPRPVDKHYCLYRRAGALDFAYAVPLSTLQTYFGPLKPSQTLPVTVTDHFPDRIRVEARGSSAGSRVVVVQQLAHPGWEVKVDGNPAYLESVGGLIGVLLPRNNRLHRVEFRYRPPLLYRGGALTLLTSVVLGLYLLRADRLLKILRHKKRNQLLDEAGQDAVGEHGEPDEGRADDEAGSAG